MPRAVRTGRVTLCVSSQVGCGMGCRFCATARMGFVRQLSAGEIVGQVLTTLHALGPRHPSALEKVMARYGAPFDPEAHVAVIGELELGDGRRLRQVRHLAGYDVIARDYLVLEPVEGESLCALGTTVAGALQFLARAGLRDPE